MFKIILVANKHDDNVGVGVVMQFPQPTLNVLKRQMLGNVVHDQSSNSTTVVAATSTDNNGDTTVDDLPHKISHHRRTKVLS